MNELRPNEKRSKIAMVFIWIVITANLLSLILGIASYGLIQTDYGNIGGFGGSSYHHAVYTLIRLFSFLYLANLIVSIVTFIRWFRRAYYNLNVLTNECAYDDSWAAKAWFIPFLNLIRPYEMMKELYDKTDKYLLEKFLLTDETEYYAEQLKPDVLKWWWGVSITLVSVYTLQFIISFVDEFLFVGMISNGIFGILKVGLLILSGIMLISIIRNYQKAEKLFTSLMESDEIKYSNK